MKANLFPAAVFVLTALLHGFAAEAQTARSLFMRSDSLEVEEIVSPEPVIYNKVGHHGPAVENYASAFRLYFNDSGAIDVYSKSGRQMELEKYLWYLVPLLAPSPPPSVFPSIRVFSNELALIRWPSIILQL